MGMYNRKRIKNKTTNEGAAVAAECGKCTNGIL
jgi:hypothetical protein